MLELASQWASGRCNGSYKPLVLRSYLVCSFDKNHFMLYNTNICSTSSQSDSFVFLYLYIFIFLIFAYNYSLFFIGIYFIWQDFYNDFLLAISLRQGF